jgi:hypothetical protein
MPGHQVEFSHDVIFDEAVFPGISTDAPAGLILPTFFDEELDWPTVFIQQPPSPALTERPSNKELTIREDDSFCTAPAAQGSPDSNCPGPRKPGFDLVPIDSPAPREISSNIDTSNILKTCRRAHMATLTSEPWYKPMAMMAIAPAHPLNHVPQTWSKAMASPDSALWAEDINEEVAAMRLLGVWEVVPQLP